MSLFEKAKPMRIRAALSRDGVEVYGDHVNMQPLETQTILLQVRLVCLFVSKAVEHFQLMSCMQ